MTDEPGVLFESDRAVSLISACRERLAGIDDTKPRFVVHRGHPRASPIDEQPGQGIVKGQQPEHHAVDEVEPEQKTQQPEIGLGRGSKEILDRDGALVADEPRLGVDGAVASESRLGSRFAVHRDIRSPGGRFGA